MLTTNKTARRSLLALAVLLSLGTLLPEWGVPAAFHLKGAEAEEAWERDVERARREQDRLIKSAKRRKMRLDTVVRRYTQQVRNETSALNHYLLGRVHWYDARPDEAVKQMKRALELDGRFYFALVALAVIEIGRKDMPKAEQHVIDLRRLKPDLPQGKKLHAQLLLSKGDPRGVEEAMIELLKADPEDVEARRLMIAALFAKKDWRRAKMAVEGLAKRQPGDPEVRVMLADCLLAMKDWKGAERELLQVLRASPGNPLLLGRLMECQVGQDDWKGATKTLRQLVAQEPKNLLLRGKLLDVLSQQQLWAEVLAEAKTLETLIPQTKEGNAYRSLVLWQQSVALVQLKRLPEAAKALVALDRMTPDVPYVLDLLQRVYAGLEKTQERVAVLERILPLLKGQPKARAELEKVIEVLKGGGEGQSQELLGEQYLVDLMRRCAHPDVEVRRGALHEYFSADIPFVDPVVYRRHDPRVEPDPQCRLWVVRILGKYKAGEAEDDVVREAARYTGLALEDPDAKVRTVAAEELGRIGAPAGFLYLLMRLPMFKFDPLPTDEEVRASLRDEYNAVRLALSSLTGKRDTPIGDAEWVPVEKMAANRAGWMRWVESTEGEVMRLKSLADLGTVIGVDPRWHLRYVLVDLIKDTSPAISLATYKVLRDAIVDAQERRPDDIWWQTFPVMEDAQVTEANLGMIRGKMRTWWTDLRSDAKAGSSKAGSGKAAGSKRPATGGK